MILLYISFLVLLSKKKKKREELQFKSNLYNNLHLKKTCAPVSRLKLEKLIRLCHNVGILNDRSQDVHINTQMLNGWRMSE